ncbi:carboxymuconolactone decarboxylase family protein [Actinomadura litoris]|uniref:carboxymuconolactone decarboxylase family protein n=1 Tax=Actinomadura litoris TaxID=2678616 RepID=UPI001C12C894|nr:carboxymuconolactone decarboxylase family protein [Actinomadura litoris]
MAPLRQPLSRPLRRALARVEHVSPVAPGAATGLVAAVYGQVERDFGMLAPPVALHSPLPDVLAASWTILRESLVVPGLAGRAAKEAVAAEVSRRNTCPYCVAVHAAAAPAATPLTGWVQRGGAGESPFPDEHAPEYIGVLVTFEYLNRMVNLFLDDSPLPPSVPGAARDPMMRLLGRMTRRRIRSPGVSAALLPAAPLPGDLAWAARTPHVAEAFARAAAAFARAGAAVPPPVRDLVRAQVAAWDGSPKGLSKGWAEEAAGALHPVDRPAGRLALLTAFASHQVGARDVAAFRAVRPDDGTLVGLAAWASFTAARAAGARVHAAGPSAERGTQT